MILGMSRFPGWIGAHRRIPGWIEAWALMLLVLHNCVLGIVEFNIEFDIIKLIHQLENTIEYGQKVNILFVLGQTYQYSCPFHSDATIVMYRDIIPSSDQKKLYELLDSSLSPCISPEGYNNGVKTLFDCRVCALYCYASARNLVSGLKINHVHFNYAGMLNDLGLLYSYVSNAPKAIEVFEEAVSINYTASSALINLATLESTLNNHKRSLELHQLAVEVLSTTAYRRDHYASLLYNYGLLLHSLDRISEAEKQWERAMEMGNYLAIANLATLMSVNGTTLTVQGAQSMYKQAMAIALETKDYHNYWCIKFQATVSVIPIIPQSIEEVIESRILLRKNLLDLISYSADNEISVMPMESIGSGSLGYYVIYQGYIDYYLRQLQAVAYWETSRPYLQSTYSRDEPEYYDLTAFYDDSSEYRYIATSSLGTKRIRVGFLSSFFYHHSVGLLLRGIIKNLNRQNFEICILAVHSDSLMDDSSLLLEFEGVLGGSAIHILDGSLDTVRSRVVSLDLDVVVFGEIGMNEMTYFLAFHRLAKRSVVFWGHALTSGITGVNRHADSGDTESIGPDYYVTSRLFEKDSGKFSQFHYGERVVLMDTLTTYFEQPPRALRLVDIEPLAGSTDELLDKKRFLLYLNPELDSTLETAEDFYLVSVPQTLYKVHLSFDTIIRQILSEMNIDGTHRPSTYIVFPVGNHNGARRAVQTRLFDTVGPELSKYILFVRFMSSMEYATLCSLSDLILDPYPVGGGRSSFEIFSTGTPIVYQYTNTTILQLTHGMYITMGIDVSHLMSRSNSQYLANVKYLLHNTLYLQQLRTNISANCHKLYNDSKVVAEWEKLFVFILGVPRPSPRPMTHLDVQSIYSLEHAVQLDNWVEEEFKNVMFNFIQPPIVLADIAIRNSVGTVVKVPTSYIDPTELVTTIPDVLIPHYAIKFWLDQEYDQAEQVQVDMVISPPATKRSPLPWDYGYQCLKVLKDKNVSSKLKLVYMCSMVGKGVTRMRRHEGTISIPVTLTMYDAEIKIAITTYVGDDIGQALYDFKHYLFDLQLSNEQIAPDDLTYVYQVTKNEVQKQYGYLIESMGAVAAVKYRKDLVRDFIRLVQQENMIPGLDYILPTCGNNPTPSKHTVDSRVTMVITTCKRLQYFNEVMRSIMSLVHDESLLAKIIVIDDNSSDADRAYMRQTYPFIEYIMKDELQRGHAASMNIMMRAVTTRYMIYLEDDWVVSSDPIIRDEDLHYTSTHTNIFSAVLKMATEIINASSATEPIHQVLFNSQVSRGCAVGHRASCDEENISRGGWLRNISSLVNTTIRYSVHEFGLMDSSYSDRIHDFSYWPGFSFNPGLWDIQAVKEKLSVCLNETNFMSETDSLFEQRFSMSTLAAGLEVAYLPMVVFTHIGDVSAYQLNQVRRPFDTNL